MPRPRSENPRREIAKTHLTKDEKIALDTLRSKFYPRLTLSDALREILLEWCAKHSPQPLEPRLVLPTVKVVSRQKNQKPRESLG